MTESTPVPGEASVEKPHTGLGTSIVEALAPQLDAIGCRIARRCAGSDRVRKKAWTTGQTDDISIASKALNAEIRPAKVSYTLHLQRQGRQVGAPVVHKSGYDLGPPL